MARTRLLTAIVLVLLLASACRTPYRPYRCGRGNLLAPALACTGYSEVELAPGVYQVRFEGGATRALTEDYTLLRSSELTLESGFRYFIVARAVDETRSQTHSTPPTYQQPQTICSGAGKNKTCVTTPGSWSGGGSYTSTLPGYAYTIRFVQDSATVEGTTVFDALSIQRDLRRKYDLP